MKRLIILLSAGLGWCWAGCSKSKPESQVIDPSVSGRLARYNLIAGDYDPQPVTTFVLSYDSADRISNAFEKNGQTQIFYSCTYSANHLSRTVDNNLGVQTYSYDGSGRIMQIDYTTPLTVGKRVFGYDGGGRLISVFDSVTNPPNFPVMTEYVYTYDGAGNNVTQVTGNLLDNSHHPTLNQETFYTFDDHANPFSGLAPLPDMRQLPGDLPALFNKNNVVATYRVGTVPRNSGGGSVPILDTIGIYTSTRKYEYNGKGLPSACQEAFQDWQYNYSGNRSFTYDY